jgi:hypothetical protein
VVRLVMDLKKQILPQVFSLAPVAAYQHRLVLDLYPAQPVDPLEALIADRLSDPVKPAAPAASVAAAPVNTAPLTPPGKAAAQANDPLGNLMAQQSGRSRAFRGGACRADNQCCRQRRAAGGPRQAPGGRIRGAARHQTTGRRHTFFKG